MNNKISHSGIIKSITDGCIKVQIVQTSACAACKVSAHCNAAESKIKIVDVYGNLKGYEFGLRKMLLIVHFCLVSEYPFCFWFAC